MKRSFRKYHLLCLPLVLTALTGMVITITEEWHWQVGMPAALLRNLHTGELFHLQAVYPILNGLGIIGLLVTGMTMTSLFNRRTPN